MEIKVAEHCGFCYGVKHAVALAEKAATDHVQGATLGPLIHNPQLIAELVSEGIACKDSLEQFAPGETVIFRSHGEGPETYAQAEKTRADNFGRNLSECTPGTAKGCSGSS